MSRIVEISPAVSRVLDSARQTAGLCGAVASHPLHVMHALFTDESRAYAILTAAGYTLNDLLTDFELVSEGSSNGEPVTGDDRDVEAALQQCRRWIRDTPGESEIQTEHLLAALAVVDADCARVFSRLNLVTDEVRGAIGANHEPLVIEEDVESHMPAVVDAESGATGSSSATPSGATGSASKSNVAASIPNALAKPATPVAEVLRILDAAANRGREGLRVVEDAARFLLNDPHLCGLLKSLRHELAAVLLSLGGDSFHASRDTVGDVGTAISTAAEAGRSS